MEKSNLFAKAVGEYIFAMRYDKSIRQKDLCRLVQISQSTLRRIEKGQVEVSAYTLRKIVLALGEDMPGFWSKVEKILAVMEKNEE